MSKKVLFCANVDLHLIGFHTIYMEMFSREGWEVHAAANGDRKIEAADKQFVLPISRNPLSFSNIRARKMLARIISEEQYDIIHCHTPTGGLVGRLAARKARKSGCRIMYTAHGFHFYRGAPAKNWLIYYPVELILSRYTDVLITMNQEDYDLANSKLPVRDVFKINGVGYDSSKFMPVDETEKHLLRGEKGIAREQEVLVYTAELNDNKNHQFLLNAMSRLMCTHPNMHLYLLGIGKNTEKLRAKAADLGLERRVHMEGYVSDVQSWMKLSDVVVSASKREGLPQNIVEALACGKPVVATKIRGHVDLIEHGVNGFLVELGDELSFAKYIEKALMSSPDMSKRAAESSGKFCADEVMLEMASIYKLDIKSKLAHKGN